MMIMMTTMTMMMMTTIFDPKVTELLVIADDARNDFLREKRKVEYMKQKVEEQAAKRAKTEKAETKHGDEMQVDESQTEKKTEEKVENQTLTDYFYMLEKVRAWNRVHFLRFRQVHAELEQLKAARNAEIIRREEETFEKEAEWVFEAAEAIALKLALGEGGSSSSSAKPSSSSSAK